MSKSVSHRRQYVFWMRLTVMMFKANVLSSKQHQSELGISELTYLLTYLRSQPVVS